MSGPLQIRNVPEETRRMLKARAASRGQSLNAYMLEVLGREVSRPTVAEVLDRAARRARRAHPSSVDAIREARDEREAELARHADG